MQIKQIYEVLFCWVKSFFIPAAHPTHSNQIDYFEFRRVRSCGLQRMRSVIKHVKEDTWQKFKLCSKLFKSFLSLIIFHFHAQETKNLKKLK